MSTEIKRKLFTVNDCYRMSEVGILSPNDRVELIRGDIVIMSPIGPRHGASVDAANRAFVRLAGDDAIVRIQGTVVLDDFCAPQPDLVLLRPRSDFYSGKNPASPDIVLILEVSDSSLEYDRTTKKELYAILGIHEYWIADLQNNLLHVYRDPAGYSYQTEQQLRTGDSVFPQLLPQCRIRTDVLLP